MKTYNLIREHWEFFGLGLSVITFLTYSYVQLKVSYEIQKRTNEDHAARIAALEHHNKNEVQEIKNTLIKIVTILETTHNVKIK